MKPTQERLILEQALATCRAHEEGLRDAVFDLDQRQLTLPDLERPAREDRRLLDQFAYRYTRLQDDIGTRLLPAALRALGEEIAAMPALDRFNRLEQLGWLPSAEEWTELRRIRNEFTHDYPDSLPVRFDRFQLALSSARRLLEILGLLSQRIHQRFSGARP